MRSYSNSNGGGSVGPWEATSGADPWEPSDRPASLILSLILLALLLGLCAPEAVHSATTTSIRNLTADTVPASGDMLLVDKATPLTTRKLTLSALTSYLQTLGIFPSPALTVTCTAPLRCAGGNSHDLSSNFTLSISSTASKCARFDGTGNLVAASGDCAAGDTTGGGGGVTSLTGTANQITVSGSTGAVTVSIPSSPTLPGTTTGTFSGNLTGNVTGNASTATSATTLSTSLSVGLGGTGLTSATDDATLVGNGTTWQAKTIPNCVDTAGNHLNYTQSTNTLSCGTSSSGSSSNSFTTIATSSGSSPVASSSTDVLNIAAGTGIIITGNSSTKTITIATTPVNNWTTVYKTSSQTVTNSNTPAADSLLTITLSIVGTYEFMIHAFASDTSPGNAEGFKATLGGTASMASLTATAKLFCTFNGTLCDIERWTNFGSIVAATGESLPDLEVTGTFEVQTPGTFYLSWSQNSSLVATSVSVLRGSTLSYRAIP